MLPTGYSSGICIARKIVRKDTEKEDWKTGKMKMPGTFQFGERILKKEGMRLMFSKL